VTCKLELNIRPMIEIVPLEQAAEAYARMMEGKARFRMVLVTKDGVAREITVKSWETR
jgi:D-arabinose 1-dehydrogenase-like Zn-dependent alcohol dehydrogenase